jgi:hypothetical protein
MVLNLSKPLSRRSDRKNSYGNYPNGENGEYYGDYPIGLTY